MSWWFHMYGRTVSSLNVYLVVGKTETLIWNLNGTQGNVWKRGERTIVSQTPYRIIIEGVRGKSYTGDIAIDDIAFAKGYCVGLCTSVKPNQRVNCGYQGISQSTCVRTRGCCFDSSVPNVPFCFYHPSSCSSINPQTRRDCGYPGISQTTCYRKGCCWDGSVPNVPHCFYGPTVPTPFPTTPVPPTTRPPSIYDCTFEGGWCNWNNSKEDDFNWYRQSGGTSSVGTGPTFDHTTGSAKGKCSLYKTNE